MVTGAVGCYLKIKVCSENKDKHSTKEKLRFASWDGPLPNLMLLYTTILKVSGSLSVFKSESTGQRGILQTSDELCSSHWNLNCLL